MIIDEISEYLEELDESSMRLVGFDECIIALTYDNSIVYDVEKIISILMKRDGMEEDEAYEFFDFNIASLKSGELNNPVFISIKIKDWDRKRNPKISENIETFF